jgi:cytochrome P450
MRLLQSAARKAFPRLARGCRRLGAAAAHRVRFHLGMVARGIKDWWLLPPGRLDPFDLAMYFDQHHALSRARQLGPIFKVWWRGGHTTCIVGHARVRRMLLAKEEALRGSTIDLRPLFPIGHVRAMHSETHRRYRRLLVQALQASPVEAHEVALREWIRDGLDEMICGRVNPVITREELRSSLRMMTAGIMLRLLFGVIPESTSYAELVAHYRRFGPEAPAWTIRHSQVAAFAEIRRIILRLAEDLRTHPESRPPPSALSYLVAAGDMDETALGNLIYMFESSHFDLYSLWTWLLQHLAVNPEVMTRFRAETDALHSRRAAEAIVLETLRLEQSEAINRDASCDILFDGYLIPRNTVVRGCLWEGHKDPRIFDDPFAFNPGRFIGRAWSIDEFAPFGLDKHRCIAADFVIAISTMFVEIVLREFQLAIASVGPPQKGIYHWEPGPDLSIVLGRFSGEAGSERMMGSDHPSVADPACPKSYNRLERR